MSGGRFDLRGKTAVVTGGGGGIGRATILEFARAGCRVAVLDVDLAAAERTAAEAIAAGAEALALACDVAAEASCRAAMAAVVERFGGVDVLVNNAGVTQLGKFADSDSSLFRRLFDINVFGAVHATQAALPTLRERRGAIVVLSSVAGFAPLYGRSAYSASKHALHGFFETLRCEMDEEGVGVLMVCPSFTATSIEKNALGGGARPTVGKAATPESVASAIRRGVETRRDLLVLNPVGKASWWLTRLAPRLYERVMTKQMRAGFSR